MYMEGLYCYVDQSNLRIKLSAPYTQC
jgi:hypothetical protein